MSHVSTFTLASMLLAATVASAEGLTYYGGVEQLLREHCVVCHTPGGLAPFSLTTHRQAAQHAAEIRRAIETGVMPPSLLVGNHRQFERDRRLTESEQRELLRWIADDCPAGTPPIKDVQRLPATSPAETDRLLVLHPAPLGARGPAGLLAADVETTDDAWVTAIEVRPRQLGFRHALLWLDLPLTSQVLEVDETGRDLRPRQLLPAFVRDRLLAPAPSALLRPAERAAAVAARDRRLLGVWAFDCLHQSLPADSALRLSPGSRLIVELETPVDGPAPLEVELHLASKQPQRLAVVAPVESVAVLGATKQESPRHGAFTVPVDCQLYALSPHADASCREMRVSLTTANGGAESLLWIEHWDPAWQTTYTYCRPLPVPAGSRLDVQMVCATTAREAGSSTPMLVGALLVPDHLEQYDELVRAMQRSQMQVAREPIKASRMVR